MNSTLTPPYSTLCPLDIRTARVVGKRGQQDSPQQDTPGLREDARLLQKPDGAPVIRLVNDELVAAGVEILGGGLRGWRYCAFRRVDIRRYGNCILLLPQGTPKERARFVKALIMTNS